MVSVGYKKFIVVGTQRTGSSVIAEQIGAHPAIACGWEWTQHLKRPGKVHLASRGLKGDMNWLAQHHRDHMLGQLNNKNCTWLGFRRLFRSSGWWLGHPRWSPAVLLDEFAGHLRWLQENPDIHVVHCRRRDNAEWLKSKALSRENSVFVGASYDESRQVHVAIDQALRQVTAKKWVDGCLADLQQTNPYIEVVYEDFVNDNSVQIGRVYRFLECDSFEVASSSTKLSKQSTKSIEDYLSNYHDLVNQLDQRNLRLG